MAVMELGWVLFDTAIGASGVAWGPRGLLGVQLPEKNRDATRARMRRRWPEAPECDPPVEVRRAIDAITTLLGGAPADLSALELDFQGVPPFHQRVYEVIRRIPPGETLTYGTVAARLGEPGAARAVGQALGRNPFALVVPCHRVVAAGGRLGGFSAAGGVITKLRLLQIERADAAGQPCLFSGLPGPGSGRG
jgi:methylated-DNA-[protein]-cysteine S-methyltransferase